MRMTAKRFEICDVDLYEYGMPLNEIMDNGVPLSQNQVCELLNELSDENEELKQFKEDVFNKIDMHLRMLPTARDNEFNDDDGDPSLYTGAMYMLETLKKELEE